MKSTKNVVDNVSNIITGGPKSKTKPLYINSENLYQTINSLYAHDKPPREDNIEKILGEKHVEK